MNANKLKSDIRKFRISLIVLTALHLAFILIIVGSIVIIVKHGLIDVGIISLWIFLIVVGSIILWVFQMIFTFVVMKYERNNMPIDRKKNNDNIQMVMFTGIIGLWLWLPNKKEINHIIKKETINQ